MIKYLVQHQKARDDWETAKKKIPDELLFKWSEIMLLCRLNGYIAPRVLGGDRLTWKQIMGAKRNYKNADQCTVCPNTYVSGDCKGIVDFKNNFKPCWIKQ